MIKNKCNLSENAKKIFNTLYCFPDETVEDCFERVANDLGETESDKQYIYDLLYKNIYRCNSPVFFNAGTNHKMFSACYVSDLQDNMNSIYDVANMARKIFQYGAGIGIPIGNLREKDADIFENNPEKPPVGKSSGPISFMELYNAVGATTKSGGRTRRAAILMAMQINHPDIIEFINCKDIDGTLQNMNISVTITDEFMQAFKDNIDFELKSPTNGVITSNVNARKLWDMIIDSAHRAADPGILFIDTINKFNLLKSKHLVTCTNPCSEIAIPPYNICNLASINLHHFCKAKEYDFKGLYETAYKIMKIMDRIIDILDTPDPRFKEMSMKFRQVGVGPMGLSDALFEMNLSYDSPEGRFLASKMIQTITTACIEASADMAKNKSKFHDYESFEPDILEIIPKWIDNEKVIEKVKKHGLRNSLFTTAAPTGTTAISCDTSYGIEPCFGLVVTKTLSETKEKMNMVNPVFQRKFEKESWYTSDLLDKIAQNKGSLKNLRGIPKEVRDIFVVAHDIKPKDRIDMQAVIQEKLSASISSTVNLPESTTRDEISEIYRYAYQKGLKGITIYRDGSKKNQPISFSQNIKQIKSNFERPSVLQANVHVVETGNGKLYVTISNYNGKPMEIFISAGKSGQTFNTFCEALGRTISLSLQHNVPVETIIKSLMGINSDRPIWTRLDENDKKPEQILSIPDAIAKLLKKYYSDKLKNEISSGTGEFCTKCGTYSVTYQEGCAVCQNCLESKCT